MVLIVSKYGKDGGTRSQGQPSPEESLNGFRLDSSQSSWLMDRLNALSEEDKLAMQTAQAHLQNSQNPQRTPPSGQEMTQGFAPGVMSDHAHHRAPEHQNIPPKPQSHSPVDEFRAAPKDNEPMDQGGGLDAESVRLREKIELLEKQIAEMTRLAEPQTEQDKDEYIEELIYRGTKLSKLRDQQKKNEIELQSRYYHGAEVHSEQQDHRRDGSFDERNEGQHDHMEDVDYEYAREYLDPEVAGDLPAERDYGHQQYAGDHEQVYSQETPGGYSDNGPGLNEEQGYAPAAGGGEWHGTHQPEYGYVGDVSQQGDVPGQQIVPFGQGQYYSERGQGGHGGVPAAGHDPHVLPQFLSSQQQQDMMRPRIMTMFGAVIAVAIISGVAYSYFGQGVSDVVKSDFAGLTNAGPADRSDAPANKDKTQADKKQTDVAVLAVSPIDVARDFAVSKLVGTAGDEVPLSVRLPSGNYPSAFMVVRNLPEWARLTKGRLVNGAWILAIADLQELKVVVPDDQPGNFSFVMEFVHSADEEPVSRTVNAVIAPVVVKSPPPAVVEKETELANVALDENSETIKAPEGGIKPGALIIDEALEEKWLERGTRLLRSGDLSAARLAFSHLAEQGSGRGALAMAMTYDPNQPSSRVVAGIKPDVRRAKFWYNRAVSLGNEAAREALRMLDK